MEASSGLQCGDVNCNFTCWGRLCNAKFEKHCHIFHKEPYPLAVKVSQVLRAPPAIGDVAVVSFNVPVVGGDAVNECADDVVEHLHDTEVGVHDEVDEQESVDEFVWATMMNLNQGSGLSNGDVESVLDMIEKVMGSGCGTTLKTMAKWKAYSDEKVENASGGIISPKNSTTITVSKADVPAMGDEIVTADFYHEDMLHFLKVEFGNTTYQGNFVMHSCKEIGRDGTR